MQTPEVAISLNIVFTTWRICIYHSALSLKLGLQTCPEQVWIVFQASWQKQLVFRWGYVNTGQKQLVFRSGCVNTFIRLTNIVLRLDTGSISAQPWKPSSLEKTRTDPIHWKTFHSQLLQEVNEANWIIKLLWILFSDVNCCTLRERLADDFNLLYFTLLVMITNFALQVWGYITWLFLQTSLIYIYYH